MKTEKKDLPKSQIELTVELSYEEFEPYITKGAESVSKEVKVEGFRPGKAPLEVIKQKVGEMTILEEAARIAINKTIDKVITENVKEQAIGQPQINITKLAPGNPMEYKIVLAILPKLEIGEYKDLKIAKEKVVVEEKEAEKTINELLEMRAKEVIVDREAKIGDKVLVDVNMFLEKVPIEGGNAHGVAVIIGKDYFVPGFDKKIIGTKKNSKIEFSLPYPADHFQKNLAGKMVEFEVEVKEIYERQIPELNDDFATAFGLKKADELKKNILDSLKEERTEKAKQKEEITIIDKIIEKTKFAEIPDMLIENESRTMMAEMQAEIERQGGKFDDYLASVKKTQEELLLELLPNAIKRVKVALLVREISHLEKVEITNEEIDKKIEELIKRYRGYEKVEERIKEPGYRSYLYSILVNQKVMDKLREWNIEK